MQPLFYHPLRKGLLHSLFKLSLLFFRLDELSFLIVKIFLYGVQCFQVISVVVEQVLYLVAYSHFICVLNGKVFKFLLEEFFLGVDGGPFVIEIVDFPKVLEMKFI